jgi:hypothetical protein
MKGDLFCLKSNTTDTTEHKEILSKVLTLSELSYLGALRVLRGKKNLEAHNVQNA